MLLERTKPVPLCEWRMEYPPNRFPEVWAMDCPHCSRTEYDDEIDVLLRQLFGEEE